MKKKYKKKLEKFEKKYKLNKLALFFFDEAKNKGFHSSDEKPDIAKYLMNLHGEISELWEAFRGGQLHKPCNKSEQMKIQKLGELSCLEEELADVFIRCLDTARAFDVDVVRAVFIKFMYNRSRPFRNGGKLA